MELNQIVGALRDRNLAEVSRRTRIPYHRVRRIAEELDTNPRYEDWYQLTQYLRDTQVAG